MTTAEYRAHPALNFSLAKHLLKSPAHFKAAQDEEREETDAMRVGTLAHAMILEGKDLRDLYAIKPAGMSFATKDGKAWRDEQTLPILREEDANSIPRMAQAIVSNQDAAAVLRGCQHREMPIFGTVMGVECKALLDVAGCVDGAWVIADLKTCQDSSARSFGWTVEDMHYDLQAAWYSTILATIHDLETPPFWVWLAIEKAAPFVNRVFTAEHWMDSGMEKLERVLTLYKECMASGVWPMPYGGMTALERPSWA
jgi:hypothetical protein